MKRILKLTDGEMKVLTALSLDLRYREIGQETLISVNTVKKHLKNIYRKLDVKKRQAAIDRYLDARIFLSFHPPITTSSTD